MQAKKNVTNKYLLTEGDIFQKLVLVALPIIGTRVIQMTYNLADMFWLGKLSSDAVAASGTVGMYLWLSMAFSFFGGVGAEIGVSQNLGRGQPEQAQRYGQTALTLGALLGVAYAAALMLFTGPLVGFFGIQEEWVRESAQSYLFIVAIGIPFNFITVACTGVFNGSGNSRIPFLINMLGLVLNMVLDPILIFNANMGIEGAALATVLAQVLTGILSILALRFYSDRPFFDFKVFSKPEKEVLAQIVRWAAPIASESFLFTFLSMLTSRLVASFGAGAMAASRVGSQIESLGWLIAGGFGTAMTAFIGQNFGAKKWSRIAAGFQLGSKSIALYGVVISVVLYLGSSVLFRVFLPNDPDVVVIGSQYLKILAPFQLLTCLEAVSSGSFRGLGKTFYPSVVSISANTFRVFLAYFLASTSLGLTGIWWAISIGAAIRGLWMFIWYMIQSKKMPKVDEVLPPSPSGGAQIAPDPEA